MILMSLLLALPSPALAGPTPPSTVKSLHCTALTDLATYRADFDREVDADTLIFESTDKLDSRKVHTHELRIERWTFYKADRLRYAIRAKDEAGRKVEFAVAHDGGGREMGNDLWWYTEAVPSQLVRFECKTVEAGK